MQTICAFLRYFSKFSFFDNQQHNRRHKAHEKSHLQTTSNSTNSTRPAYMDLPPQRIRTGWMDHNQLTQLLDRKFGSHYSLECRSDIYYLHSSVQLTEGEIMSCISSDAQR